VTGWVYDQPGRFVSPRLVDPVNDLTFVIGLMENKRKAVALGRVPAKLLDVGERRAAIDVWRLGPLRT
jgi:hypothetical protein